LPARAPALCLVGSGALGLALDAAQCLLAPLLEVPILRAASFDRCVVPEGTAVVAAAFDGAVPEVAHQLSMLARGASSLVLLSARGPLRDSVQSEGGSTIDLDPRWPDPRSAFTEVVAAVLLGAAPSLSTSLAEAAAALTLRAGELEDAQAPTAQLARALDRSFPVVTGLGGLGSVAARRLKSQVNEHAKSPAFWAAYPQIAYDEVAGYGQNGDVTRQVLALVEVRHDQEHPIDRCRRDAVVAQLEETFRVRLELTAAPGDPVLQLLDLCLAGDLVALRLAERYGIDPGPVPAISEVKAQVAALFDPTA